MSQDRRPRYILALLLFLLVILPLLTGGVDLLVDWLWFGREGFRVIYLNILKAQIKLSTLAGTGFILVVGMNTLFARSLAGRQLLYHRRDEIEIPALERMSSAVRGLIWVGILLLGYFIGNWAMTHWNDYLLAQGYRPLGQTDPLFSVDLGFYLFKLPFQWFLYHLALVTVLACLLSALFLYMLEGT